MAEMRNIEAMQRLSLLTTAKKWWLFVAREHGTASGLAVFGHTAGPLGCFPAAEQQSGLLRRAILSKAVNFGSERETLANLPHIWHDKVVRNTAPGGLSLWGNGEVTRNAAAPDLCVGGRTGRI